MQYSHGFFYSLYSIGARDVGKKALKLWVTQHQEEELVCIQTQLIKGVLKERRHLLSTNLNNTSLTTGLNITGELYCTMSSPPGACTELLAAGVVLVYQARPISLAHWKRA